MNYSVIKNNDIADGQGVRVSLFVSGCDHHCKGCFQPETWDYRYGNEYNESTEKEILEMINSKNIQGLTLLGGDPMCGNNPESLISLVEKTKELGKDVWCYTGYKFEELIDMRNEYIDKLLSMIDVLVDGEFVENLKDIRLQFRGSSNQRLILCNKSTKEKIELWSE